MKQIIRSVVRFAKRFEPELCVFFLIAFSLNEQRRNLFIVCFLSNGRKVCIFIS